MERDKQDIVPLILRPEYADALIDVINKLHFVTFLELTKTCRYLDDFCWNTKGIKIPFKCALDVSFFGFQVWIEERSHSRSRRTYLTNAQIERFLERKNFLLIQLESIHFTDVLDEASMARTNDYLTKIGCEFSERLWVNDVSLNMELELLIQFVEKVRVKEFRCDSPLPRESVTYFLQNMTCFHYDSAAPIDFFFETRAPPQLHLMGANSFPFDHFIGILQGWGKFDFEIDEWNLGRDFHRSDPFIYFKFLIHFNFTHVENFFDAPRPSTRPLFLLQNRPRFLLRADGQILAFFYEMNGERGLFLRQMNFCQLRQRLPKFFPTTDDRLFDNIPIPKNKKCAASDDIPNYNSWKRPRVDF